MPNKSGVNPGQNGLDFSVSGSVTHGRISGVPLDNTNFPATEVDGTTALLIRARGFVERGWCQRTNAQDARRFPVPIWDKRAAAWCAAGAVFAAGVAPDNWRHPAFVRLKAAIGANVGVHDFNDSQRTVEPVLAAFDRAIAAGQSREG
jgi:hypothetical protein